MSKDQTDETRSGELTKRATAMNYAASAKHDLAGDSTDIDSSALKVWLAPTIAAIAIVGLSLLVMNLAGLFPVPATDAGEKTLAAALVLIGTIVSASVSLIGLVVKSSIDNRTAQLARIKAQRNHALASEAEHRNRIDTVIRAIGLLGTNGQNATRQQVSGSLLALISLGEHDLAVALAAQLWSDDLVSRRAIGRVATEAFRHGSRETQYAVAVMLLENATKLPGNNRVLLWPIVDLGWPANALPVCRIALVMAAIHCFIAQLQQSQSAVPGAAAILFEALNDSEPQVRNLAQCSLRPFAEAMEETEWIHTGTKVVTIGDIRQAFGSALEPALSSLAADYEKQVKELMTKERNG